MAIIWLRIRISVHTMKNTLRSEKKRPSKFISQLVIIISLYSKCRYSEVTFEMIFEIALIFFIFE